MIEKFDEFVKVLTTFEEFSSFETNEKLVLIVMEELKFGKTVILVVRFEVISKLELIVAVVERIGMELTRI
jgi:hypothetical protein